MSTIPHSESYRINEFIELKYNGKTDLYVCDEKLDTCKYLLLSIPADEIVEYNKFSSIDEIIEYYDNSHEHDSSKIPPETEYWGHCSNIEAWVEHNYDIRLLDSRLSVPIIKKILKSLMKGKEKTKFREFLFTIIESLDWLYHNRRHNEAFRDKWIFLKPLLFKQRREFGYEGWLSRAEISGSAFLEYLHKFWKEQFEGEYTLLLNQRRIKKRKRQQGYYERKLWGSRNDDFNPICKFGCENWLEYRRMLRDIRRGHHPIVSDEMDYIAYLYAKGNFTEAGEIDFISILTSENTKAWVLRDSDMFYMIREFI